MGKVAILETNQSSVNLTVSDCAHDLRVWIEAGKIDSKAKMIAIILMDENDEELEIKRLVYGLKTTEIISLLEYAKMAILREMLYEEEAR